MTPEEQKRQSEAIKWAVEAERRRCARIAEEFNFKSLPDTWAWVAGVKIAQLIREVKDDAE